MASDDWQVEISHKKCRMEALRTLIVVFCLRSWVQRDSGLRRLVCRSNQQKVQDKGFICHNCGPKTKMIVYSLIICTDIDVIRGHPQTT